MSTPDPALVRAAEAAEMAAVESAVLAAPSTVATAARLGRERLEGALLVHAAAFDVLMHNRVVGLGVEVPARMETVDAAEARFRALGAKRFMVPLAPGAEPADLADRLAARGFYRHNHWIRLVREAADPPVASTDLRVAPLGAAQAAEFGRLEAEAFGHPPEIAAWHAALVGRDGWNFYGAFDGGTLAGVGGLHVHGPAAWIGYASTRADYRGRGAQSALIAARLDAAREAGCRWCVVETAADTPEKPNPSTHNLRRMGFRDAYERPNWVKVLEPPAAT